MITETVEAWQLDPTDVITLGDDDCFVVVEHDVTGEGVSVTLKNDDGDLETFYFTDTDPITLVVSLDDPDEDV